MHRKSLYTFMSFFLVTIFVSLACAISQPTPTSTPEPSPSATPTATQTPTATRTPPTEEASSRVGGCGRLSTRSSRHQSSHVGDEFLLRNRLRNRVNLSYESFDLRLSYEFFRDALRIPAPAAQPDLDEVTRHGRDLERIGRPCQPEYGHGRRTGTVVTHEKRTYHTAAPHAEDRPGERSPVAPFVVNVRQAYCGCRPIFCATAAWRTMSFAVIRPSNVPLASTSGSEVTLAQTNFTDGSQ